MNKEIKIKKNDSAVVEICDITDLGFGVGRLSQKVVFVSDTVPDDVAEIKIIKVNSSYLIGKVIRFIRKSDKRTHDRCSEVGCHSCAYKNISYEYECSLKEESVRRLFSRAELSHIRCEKIISSPMEKRYRNKAQYPVTLIGEDYRVGFFAPKSHRVTPVSDCPLTPSVFSEIASRLCSFFKKERISVYSEADGTGLLRHVYLRRGETTGEVLLTIVINGASLPSSDELVRVITSDFPEVVGILLNVNTEDTNVVLGDKFITLYGRDFICDTLLGIRLKVTAPSFYQVNRMGAELLYSKAKELAAPDKSDVILDLYCGAGSIGLTMARDAAAVYGIEIVDSAVECAKENALANGIDNAYFYTGDAKDTEGLLANAERQTGSKIHPDIIILDPPRAGCDEKLISYAASLNPKRIVYISCNPKTLARDVMKFIELDYNTDSVTPVDMFPCTGHVESLVCLTKQTN